jgi:hypothetical protein
VDAKLIALATRLSIPLLTNDQPLTRVAELRGIRCLSMNRLANSPSPVRRAGEIVQLEITKSGQQEGGGVCQPSRESGRGREGALGWCLLSLGVVWFPTQGCPTRPGGTNLPAFGTYADPRRRHTPIMLIRFSNLGSRGRHSPRSLPRTGR